ncbi:MAG: GIY-YIG nuclease family protein [Candidatus Eremiobacteraeota bacterium]|nr:GIY-YIG nuclease family protein [Candidatus Eremiobacteraeota bacterium]MBV8366981.1 GIY-YIG nuclease family protein [Candidatus Eremiobacteraeota bacterium]
MRRLRAREKREHVHRATVAGLGSRVLRALRRRWHYVYLARARDGSYYCGYALDPDARVAAHNAGKGSKALRGRIPVRLAFTRRFSDKGDALRFECELKCRTPQEKATLSERWLRSR